MESKSQRGERPLRRQKTDDRILAAITELLRSGGANAVTMDAVRQKSGVSKATLYARYTDRVHMLERAADQMSGSTLREVGLVEIPISLETLESLLRLLQTTLTERVGPIFLGDLLVREESYIDAWRDKVVRPEMEAMADIFTRGVTDGTLRPDANYSLIIELILGGLVASGAVHDGIPENWAHDLAVTLWPLISASPMGRSQAPQARPITQTTALPTKNPDPSNTI